MEKEELTICRLKKIIDVNSIKFVRERIQLNIRRFPAILKQKYINWTLQKLLAKREYPKWQ